MADDMFINIRDLFVNSIARSENRIKVTTEEMIQKAASLDVKIKKMQQIFDELDEKVNNTSSYWEGEASNIYRNEYSEHRENAIQMIARLSEHVRDLNAMAGVYEDTENKIKEISNDLPNDVII